MHPVDVDAAAVPFARRGREGADIGEQRRCAAGSRLRFGMSSPQYRLICRGHGGRSLKARYASRRTCLRVLLRTFPRLCRFERDFWLICEAAHADSLNDATKMGRLYSSGRINHLDVISDRNHVNFTRLSSPLVGRTCGA